jgi:hypothetical protein
MESKRTDEELKTYGQGKAQILNVRRKNSTHEVIVYNPDHGTTEWIPYVQMAGIFRVPNIGEFCYIFCDDNFHDYPIAWGHRLTKKLISQLTNQKESNIMVIYSSGADEKSVSQKIELDDGEEAGIRITTAENHTIKMNDSQDKGVFVETSGGNKIEVKDEESITVTQKDGTKMEMTADKIEFTVQGTKMILDATGIQMLSASGSALAVTSSITMSPSGGATAEMGEAMKLASASGSELEVGTTIKGIASDTNSTFDGKSVSKHLHDGNLGFPTSPPK